MKRSTLAITAGAATCLALAGAAAAQEAWQAWLARHGVDTQLEVGVVMKACWSDRAPQTNDFGDAVLVVRDTCAASDACTVTATDAETDVSIPCAVPGGGGGR